VRLLYSLIKIAIRFALKIFCHKIYITGTHNLFIKGPALIIANHPNSFLDSLIIGSQFSQPIHFLARGDAFNKSWHSRLLRLLNMVPVYRFSEGKENLSLNETAFRRSEEILAAGGIILIFIEGVSVNKHQLQSFKKGAARIGITNKAKKGFKILPLGISYDSFDRFGKNVKVNTGEPLLPATLFLFEEEAKNIRHFNAVIHKEINKRIDLSANPQPVSKTKKYVLFLPAVAGYLLHAPFYAIIKKIVKKKTTGTVFYDSVLFGVLLFLYPLSVLFLGLILLILKVPLLTIAGTFFLLPLLARCLVEWRGGSVPNPATGGGSFSGYLHF
jgi:1-acyl-sn-glycerol-3-phosphate acyltransferase